MRTTWDPAGYLRHADARARPFHDLLARVGAASPARVVDLGCGPGGLTRLLSERWPSSYVLGIDSSAEMIGRAEAYALPGRCEFVHADVRDWRPDRPVDVIVSNATLQWVPGHVQILPRWVAALRPGGWLAVQVPANFDAPSHALMREVAASRRWRSALAGVLRHGDAVESPATYLEVLARAGCSVDAWQTTYLHVLPGDDAVLDWVRGTGLRPVLDALPADEADEFLTAYAESLRAAYPPGEHGTVFPFTRTFVVAHRTGEDHDAADADAPTPARTSRPDRGAIDGLHHVQLACPAGSEESLRGFYVGVLGMTELAKPATLAGRGGAWFRSGAAELHLGVETPFRPARKAHPGLLVRDIDACAAALAASGAPVGWDPLFPGHRRLYTNDPVGNRIELLAPEESVTGTG